jgi:hypothetical protein
MQKFASVERITTVEKMPDGSGKPGEAMYGNIVPELKRTAGTTDNSNTVADIPFNH